MYEAFYNLRMMPFENTPDPRFFYESEEHCEAMAAIEFTIRLRKGFALVTGDIGSGKTTVGRLMCERIGDRAEIVRITHGHETPGALLRQVLRQLHVKTRRGDDHGRLLERLQRRAAAALDRNRPIVLFVDEAQNLSPAVLEELRLTSSFDTATHKAIQVVLIGQPELRQRICQPDLSALRQRIAMARQLHPLDRDNTVAYVYHRLKVASEGAEPAVTFDAGACNRLYQSTGGVPRLINAVADNCLVLGMVRKTRTIDAKLVDHVVRDMIPSFTDEAPAVTQPKLALAGNF